MNSTVSFTWKWKTGFESILDIVKIFKFCVLRKGFFIHIEYDGKF